MIGLSAARVTKYIAEYVDLVSTEQNLSKKSRKNRRCALNRISTYLGGKSFTYEALRKYFTYLRTTGIVSENKKSRQWGERSVSTEIGYIRAFLNYLQRSGYISERDNFGKLLQKPKVHELVRTLPNINSVAGIIIAGTAPHPSRKGFRGDNSINVKRKACCKDVMLLILDTGLRSEEALSIKKSNVNLQNSLPCITITSKGGNQNQIPIPVQHIKMLEVRLKGLKSDDDAVFPITKKTCNAALKRGSFLLRLPIITLHDLRRVYAQNLSENGANDYQIRDALRHTSVITTQRYVRHDLTRLNRVISKYHSRNKIALPISEVFDQVERQLNDFFGSEGKFNVKIDRDNTNMVIKVSANNLKNKIDT